MTHKCTHTHSLIPLFGLILNRVVNRSFITAAQHILPLENWRIQITFAILMKTNVWLGKRNLFNACPSHTITIVFPGENIPEGHFKIQCLVTYSLHVSTEKKKSSLITSNSHLPSVNIIPVSKAIVSVPHKLSTQPLCSYLFLNNHLGDITAVIPSPVYWAQNGHDTGTYQRIFLSLSSMMTIRTSGYLSTITLHLFLH
jgi:hypothetical protein